jgi:hypothetical protein
MMYFYGIILNRLTTESSILNVDLFRVSGRKSEGGSPEVRHPAPLIGSRGGAEFSRTTLAQNGEAVHTHTPKYLPWLRRHGRELVRAKVGESYFRTRPQGIRLVGFYSTTLLCKAKELTGPEKVSEFMAEARMRGATLRFFSSRELPSFIDKL